jgi:purine-binding chemotaxis protein CheW
MSAKKSEINEVELAIFEVGDITCAAKIDMIQEINKNLEISAVPHAPDYIRGMQNLRGTIITILDMRSRFGMEQKPFNEDMRILVVENKDEKIGLLVDKMMDVIQADTSEFEAPPSNVQGIAGTFFSNIYKMEGKLAALLNIDEILAVDVRS